MHDRSRVDAGGAKDEAFGDGGYVAWKGPFDKQAPLGCALALQPDGKFVVLNQGSIARFLENGAPDIRFGGGVTTGVPGAALAVQSNGKIVIAGREEAGRFALWRLGASGERDLGFGNAGTVVTPLLGAGGAESLAIQPDGRIIASGWTEPSNETPVVEQAALTRYFGD